MGRVIHVLLGVLAVIGLASGLVVASATPPARAADQPERNRFDTVVIDAGHGGEDAGARGPGGTLEKDVVLAVARELAERLGSAGLQVVMTRDRDVFVPLEQRTAIANDARGDLFLSIHGNASTDHAIHGTETYFLALEASDEGAAAVASRENGAFGKASGIAAMDDPFIALIGDLIATEHLEESNDLARLVQNELTTTSLKSRGVKQALFVVLTGVQMPAALVEIGFVTSTRDERELGNARGRDKIASALERAVLEFGRRYDARRGLAGKEPVEPAAAEGR